MVDFLDEGIFGSSITTGNNSDDVEVCSGQFLPVENESFYSQVITFSNIRFIMCCTLYLFRLSFRTLIDV